MLKKAGVVAAAAAGLIMLGAPAFASTASLQGEGWGGHHHPGQVGLVNVSNVDILHNVNAVVGACGDNVGVLGAAVPVMSPVFTKTCASGGIANG